jgi:hypothetical protein
MSERLRTLLVGLYASTTAVLFGATFLDIVYAHSLKNVLDPSESTLVFTIVSDTLLRMGFILVMAGIGALVSSLPFKKSRKFISASLLVFFLVLAIPFVFPFLKYTNISPWIRLCLTGLVPLLAFVGLHEYYLQP